MDTFPFTSFTVQTRYLPSGSSLQFGSGYTFTSAPDAPIQREFTLNLSGYKYFQNLDGTIDYTTNATLNNIGALEQFLAPKGQWDPFLFEHPIYGPVVVLVSVPLQIPKGLPGGNGVVDDLQITLLEQPGVGLVDVDATIPDGTLETVLPAKTTAFTATAGRLYHVDTTAAAFVGSLPPLQQLNLGDTFGFIDTSGACKTNHFTISLESATYAPTGATTIIIEGAFGGAVIQWNGTTFVPAP